MTNKLREAAQQALEALRNSKPNPSLNDDEYGEKAWDEHFSAITALRAALMSVPDGAEQPAEPEPAARISEFACSLRTAPQPAKRVSLTREHVRASGGIVHSDGNVFFTSLEHLNSAVESANSITGETK